MLFKNKSVSFEIKSKYNAQKKTKASNFKLLNETMTLQGQTVLAGDSITEIFNDYELFTSGQRKTTAPFTTEESAVTPQTGCQSVFMTMF